MLVLFHETVCALLVITRIESENGHEAVTVLGTMRPAEPIRPVMQRDVQAGSCQLAGLLLLRSQQFLSFLPPVFHVFTEGIEILNGDLSAVIQNDRPVP